MPLSISSSNPITRTSRPESASRAGSIDRRTVALIGTIIVVLLAAELVSRVGFDRISKVQRRELSQRSALLAVKDTDSSAAAHVAVLGNSLMLDGTNVPLFTETVNPNLVPVPYFVLGTEYYDWYFALKLLFAQGMRPRYVVLGLSPNQFASSYTKGDYASRYLFRTSDLFEVIRATHMDATTASGFLLAHFSEFYSAREVIRGFVQLQTLPSVAALLHDRVASGHAPPLNEALLAKTAAERLPALNRLCRENGSEFILVVPPTYQTGAETIARVGRERQVTVLTPVANDELDSSFFQVDGFHLNDRGAQVFTTKLARELRELPIGTNVASTKSTGPPGITWQRP